MGKTCSVISYGAKGDGDSDDTAAFQRAFDACSDGHGAVLIEEGTFLITATITSNASSVDVRGVGEGSLLLWADAGDLFSWTQPVSMMLVADFAVASVGMPKPLNATALRFHADCTKSSFENLQFIGAGSVSTPHGTRDTHLLGTCMDLGPVTDTVEVRGCLLWFLAGTGIAIGRGSEVRIEGGRIIGAGVRNDSSVGIHVRGNNGGVHIEGTDVIGLHIGIMLKDTLGVGSNR